tara:strand:- start:1984 stop:2742 length:759 start_codon:yes stop_codon:yes gene_type:complete
MKIIAITQARVGSNRLPEKILKKINNKSILQIHLERIKRSKLVNKIIVATTKEPKSSKITEICKDLNIEYYCGDTNDVLDRFYNASLSNSPDYIVRLTSDCPLIDPQLLDDVVKNTVNKDYDYGSNTIKPTFPDGMDVEVFKFSSLEIAFKKASLNSEREHVTPYIWKNCYHHGGKMFSSYSLTYKNDYSKFRLTLDEGIDFILIKKLILKCGDNKSWLFYVNFLLNNPKLIDINSSISRNEGYQNSIINET